MTYAKFKKKYSGFSILELLVTIALISMLFGMTVPIGIDFIAKNNITVAKETVVNTLRTAQHNSINLEQSSNWGVYTQQNSLIMYMGDTYATRDTDFDLLNQLPSGIAITSGMDINFTQLSGDTSANSNIVVSSARAKSKTVQINTEGVVSH
jgi:prepilin-type N-terminal cleavage/methylation domain-containing protein